MCEKARYFHLYGCCTYVMCVLKRIKNNAHSKTTKKGMYEESMAVCIALKKQRMLFYSQWYGKKMCSNDGRKHHGMERKCIPMFFTQSKA